MSERKCETCGTVEYGILGKIGVLGYSLLIALLGYTFSQLFYDERIIVIVCLVAILLMLPMWFISYQEEARRGKAEDRSEEE